LAFVVFESVCVLLSPTINSSKLLPSLSIIAKARQADFWNRPISNLVSHFRAFFFRVQAPGRIVRLLEI
jgi:hypothetical protein